MFVAPHTFPVKVVHTRSGVFVGVAAADARIEAKMAAVVFMVLGSELVMVPMCGRKGMEGRGGRRVVSRALEVGCTHTQPSEQHKRVRVSGGCCRELVAVIVEHIAPLSTNYFFTIIFSLRNERIRFYF